MAHWLWVNVAWPFSKHDVLMKYYGCIIHSVMIITLSINCLIYMMMIDWLVKESKWNFWLTFKWVQFLQRCSHQAYDKCKYSNNNHYNNHFYLVAFSHSDSRQEAFCKNTYEVESAIHPESLSPGPMFISSLTIKL